MSSDPVKDYATSVVKRRIASLCLALGWNSTHSSAMDIMQDLMVRYIKLIGTETKQRAELCSRTQPDLMDLQSTFDHMGINVDELSEYVEQFDYKALVTESVPIFPQPTETHLNHLKPGSREVLHRPYHIYDYLPPMYPEMEGTEDENMPSMSTSLDENKIEIKTEAPTAQPGDSSDLHPLREIASVIMTSSGFISETREGRMADAKTPIVRQMSVAPTTSAPPQSTGNSGPSGSGGTEHTKTPQGPTKAKPSKPADETDSEGIIEDSDEDDFKTSIAPEQSPAPSKTTGSKLSVFQKKKAATPKTLKSPKTPKIPKTPKPPKAERIKEKKTPKSDKPKGKPGRPKGVKNKDKKIVAPQTISKEYLSSSDSDSSPETPKKQKSEKPSGSHKRDRPDVPATAAPPPAKKVKMEPPVELNVDITSLPSLPDPSILPNNPLIPKAFFGFENMNTFEPLKAPTPMPKPQPTPKPNKPEKSEPIVEKVKAVKAESHHEEPLFQPPVKSIPDKKSSNTTDKESSDKKKEKKKEKALKKAKKEKKEKNREKERNKDKSEHGGKSEKSEKSEKKEKEKKSKKKERREDKPPPQVPELFGMSDQTTIKHSIVKPVVKSATPKAPKTPSIPKLKFKDLSDSPTPAPPGPLAAVASTSVATAAESSVAKSSPKIVFKNLAVDKKKDPPKQADLFSDAVHLDRPKSAMSDTISEQPSKLKAALATPTTSHHPSKKEKKESSGNNKEKKSDSESSRKRSSSGQGGKRGATPGGSKRGSTLGASAGEPTIKVAPIPEEPTADPGTPTFGGGSVVTESVGHFVDAEGNEIWICPQCNKPDDGSPMIGCDAGCEDWYHWVCVGIHQEPNENQDWICPRCIKRK